MTPPLSDWDFWEPVPRITVNLALCLMQSLNTLSVSLIFEAPTDYGSRSILSTDPFENAAEDGRVLSEEKI